jgi:MFS family permease
MAAVSKKVAAAGCMTETGSCPEMLACLRETVALLSSSKVILRTPVHNRWLILAVLFLARTTMGFQFQSVATLSDFLVPQFGVTYTELGLLIGSYLLPGIVVAYPGGMLGKRWGDKQIAILGLTLMVVGGLVDGASIHYATFFGGRLIAGIGAVLLNVLLTKMATDWFVGHEIGTALALLVSSWPIGIGIALIVLPWVAITFSVPMAPRPVGGQALSDDRRQQPAVARRGSLLGFSRNFSFLISEMD